MLLHTDLLHRLLFDKPNKSINMRDTGERERETESEMAQKLCVAVFFFLFSHVRSSTRFSKKRGIIPTKEIERNGQKFLRLIIIISIRAPREPNAVLLGQQGLLPLVGTTTLRDNMSLDFSQYLVIFNLLQYLVIGPST